MRIPNSFRIAQTPTPIEFLPKFNAEIGGANIWVKRDDLTGSVLTGNKARKLEFVIAEAADMGAKVIMTSGGLQSNHCRSTALVCAKFGLKCHLVLRGEKPAVPDGNLLLDMLAGAEITYIPDEGYATGKPQIVDDIIADYTKQGIIAYWSPIGASNAVGSLGYMVAWDEIMQQQENMGVKFDHVVIATGSGGSFAGLIAGRAIDESDEKPQVWGVNIGKTQGYPTGPIRDILNEIQDKYELSFTDEASPINVIDGFVGEGYGIPYPEEIETIKLAARTEGLILDPVYTGKAFHAVVTRVREGFFKRDKNILYIHSGGLFGLFPQRDIFFK
ncbi:D-cysteine desulfhydrase family protein [Candidatus Sumerlaeota bacterium]|nr:D-cysteine desulfhydrase family protein [Candidatus Sumerlaeota bacterium]